MTRKMQQIIDDEQNALVKQARSMTTRELIIFIAKNDLHIPIDFEHTRQELEDRFLEICYDKFNL